jgi:hypothetical protein
MDHIMDCECKCECRHTIRWLLRLLIDYFKNLKIKVINEILENLNNLENQQKYYRFVLLLYEIKKEKGVFIDEKFNFNQLKLKILQISYSFTKLIHTKNLKIDFPDFLRANLSYIDVIFLIGMYSNCMCCSRHREKQFLIY